MTSSSEFNLRAMNFVDCYKGFKGFEGSRRNARDRRTKGQIHKKIVGSRMTWEEFVEFWDRYYRENT